MPQIFLAIVAGIQMSFVTIYTCHNNEGHYQMKSQLRTFSNLTATAFMLFYLFFPTLILMFAYPTQIIVIFTFVIAYLFATAVFSAAIVKLHKLCPKQNKSDSCCNYSFSCCCDFKKYIIPKLAGVFMAAGSVYFLAAGSAHVRSARNCARPSFYFYSCG